jgi:hypothetical protein
MSITGQDLTAGAAVTASGGLTIASGKTLDMNGNDLSVSGTFTNNGTLKLKGDETITAPSILLTEQLNTMAPLAVYY